jgi:hypothetical protein
MSDNGMRSRVVGCVVMVLLLVACGAPTPTPTALPTPTPEPTPTAKPATAQDYIKAMDDALNAAGTYHFDLDGAVAMEVPAQSVKLDIPMTLAGDVQAPDRMQASLNMTVMGVPIDTEVIAIGDEAWAKDPTTGQWVTTPGSEAPVGPQQFTELSDFEMGTMTVVGEETLDGQQVVHLTGKVDEDLNLGAELGGPMQLSLGADYWIAKESNLPLKATMAGSVPITPQSVEMTVGMSMTMLFSGFGEPVTIEPPSTATPTP